MKKILSVGLVMVLVLTSCGPKKKLEEKNVNTEAKLVSYENVEEMENDSNFIGKIKRLEGDEESVINKVNGTATLHFTFTKAEIEEIYKDSSNSLNVGDVITIMENEVYDEDTNIRYHVEGYDMMVPNKEYLFFGVNDNYNSVNYYCAAGVLFGTISLENDGRNKNLGEGLDLNWFNDFWQECKDKYKK